jgi:predicted enzyme related to lactoylglutathione lyase
VLAFPQESPLKAKYVHTNLIAHDWKKMVAFYVEVFGCRPKPPERDLAGPWLDGLTGLPGARLRGLHLILPGWGDEGPTLEVFEYDANLPNPAKQVHTEGFGHIAFAVEDVEACLAEVLRHGGSAVGGVVKSAVPGVGLLHVVYARDPEGNIVELQKWD